MLETVLVSGHNATLTGRSIGMKECEGCPWYVPGEICDLGMFEAWYPCQLEDGYKQVHPCF